VNDRATGFGLNNRYKRGVLLVLRKKKFRLIVVGIIILSSVSEVN